MFEVIKQNILYPLAGRLGMFASGSLVTIGASQQHADWVSLGIVGLLGVGLDLSASYIRRKWLVGTAFGAGWDTALGLSKDGPVNQWQDGTKL